MLKDSLFSAPIFLPFFNPFIFSEINSMENYQGINSENPREHKIIVSVYSDSHQLKNLPITLYSLLNQSLKPDKLILWLDEEMYSIANLPYEITRFFKNGLDVKFTKNIKSYTNSISAFKEYNNSIIVTASANIYYRKDWLKSLYHSYIANPNDIHVHLGLKINKKQCGTLASVREWKINNYESSAYDNFFVGAGGILYPPNCFTKEVLRKDIFFKNASDFDDAWFWIMALINDRKIRIVKNHYLFMFCTNIMKYKSANYIQKDSQLTNLLKFYGQNVITKLDKI